MSKNQTDTLPLRLIIIGSILLALPALYGTMFLFIFAAEAITKPYNAEGSSNLLGILYPLPAIIGFLLLGGYIWTAIRKRFINWFWWISAIFNLLITLLSGGFLVKMAYENIRTSASPNILALLFFLFPLWTLFVTIASVKYAFYKPQTESLDLP